MKRTLILTLFTPMLLGITAQAQEQVLARAQERARTQTQKQDHRFGFSATIGTAIALDSPSVTPFSFQAAGYYNISKRFAAGVGTGISCYEKTLVPFFGDVRFILTRPRKFTPYLSMAAGYAFAPAEDANGGMYLNPQMGVQYALKCRMRLFLGIGYESQRLERLKAHTGSHFSAAYCEKLHHNAVSIRIGMLF